MRILKVYTDDLVMHRAVQGIGTDNDKWVVNYNKHEQHLELANGVVFHFKNIKTLADAQYQISGCIYSFVEFHSEEITQEAKEFIWSRVRDPMDYSSPTEIYAYGFN